MSLANRHLYVLHIFAQSVLSSEKARTHRCYSLVLRNPQAHGFVTLPAIICTAITSSGKSTEVLRISACIDFAHTLVSWSRGGVYPEPSPDSHPLAILLRLLLR